MSEMRTTDAVLEPVTVSQVKDQAVIEHNDDDAYISQLIRAARYVAESQLGRPLLSQTWTYSGRRFYPQMQLTQVPVISITSIKYTDTEGAEQTLASDQYVLELGEPAIVEPAYGVDWPDIRQGPDAVKIEYVAGYGTAAQDVPASIRHAILMLVSDFYEQRASVYTGGSVSVLPTAAERLLKPYRSVLF